MFSNGVYLFLLLLIGCQCPQSVQSKDKKEEFPSFNLTGIIEIEPMRAAKIQVQVDCDCCFPEVHEVETCFTVPVYKKKLKTSIWGRRPTSTSNNDNLGEVRIIISIETESGFDIRREWRIKSTENQQRLNEMTYIFKIGAFKGPLALRFSIIGSSNEELATNATTFVVRGKTDENEMGPGHGIVLAQRKFNQLSPNIQLNLRNFKYNRTPMAMIEIKFRRNEIENIFQYMGESSSRIALEIWNSQIDDYQLGSATFYECPFCKEKIENGEEILTIMPCNHITHLACSAPWFANPKNGCPLCRSAKKDYEFLIENPVFSNAQYEFKYVLPLEKLLLYGQEFIHTNQETIDFRSKETEMLSISVSSFFNQHNTLLTSEQLKELRNWEFMKNRLQTIEVVNSDDQAAAAGEGSSSSAYAGDQQ